MIAEIGQPRQIARIGRKHRRPGQQQCQQHIAQPRPSPSPRPAAAASAGVAHARVACSTLAILTRRAPQSRPAPRPATPNRPAASPCNSCASSRAIPASAMAVPSRKRRVIRGAQRDPPQQRIGQHQQRKQHRDDAPRSDAAPPGRQKLKLQQKWLRPMLRAKPCPAGSAAAARRASAPAAAIAARRDHKAPGDRPAGGTAAPSWSLMTSQVEPQISATSTKGTAMRGRSSAWGEGGLTARPKRRDRAMACCLPRVPGSHAAAQRPRPNRKRRNPAPAARRVRQQSGARTPRWLAARTAAAPPAPTAISCAAALAWRGQFQPQTAVQQRQNLRRHEAALGLQVPGALAPPARQLGLRRIEEYDRLGIHPAILGAAEAKRIHRPRRLCRGAAQKGHCIGKPRAIHMQAQPARLAPARQSPASSAGG